MADTKVTALTADTAPTSDDLVVTVNDAGGTPANRKVTIDNLSKAINLDNVSSGTTNKVYTATEQTKLSGIETAADVTDATNVAAAGAVMEGDTTTASMSFVVDEDNMVSDLATKVPTQQSVKAYADTKQPLDTDLTTLSTAFTSASASGAASLAFHEDTDNGTNKITMVGVASVTSDKTLTLPDATDTLVGKATTDTLTNKTIDLGGNTVTATSAQLATALSDETGTGLAVFNNSPTFVDDITVGGAGVATGQVKISGTTSGTAVITVPAVAGTPTYVLPAAVGGAGTFLKDASGDGVLSWATPSGSGDVSKVGTPVNNQVGVWTGDGTLEGDAALTFDTTTDTLTTGVLNATGLTASEIVITDASKNLTSAAVATYPSLTELTYVKGVTSAIQTQVNAKAPLASPTFTGTVTVPVGLTGVLRADTGVVSVDTDVTDIVAAGSSTAQGKLELATDAETVTGTDTARATTPANITAKMAAPGAIGGTTPAAGTFTTVTTTGNVELGHASDTTIARVSAGVASIEGVNILTVAGGTLTGNLTLGENTSIALDPAGSADGKYSGITIAGTAGATLAFGDVIVLDVTASKWLLADANSAAAADGDARGLIGMCVLAANDTQATTILLNGTCRADANFPTLTVTAPVYLSETAGDIVVAQPTTTDVVIRVLGFALTADEIYFNPSPMYFTHT